MERRRWRWRWIQPRCTERAFLRRRILGRSVEGIHPCAGVALFRSRRLSAGSHDATSFGADTDCTVDDHQQLERRSFHGRGSPAPRADRALRASADAKRSVEPCETAGQRRTHRRGILGGVRRTIRFSLGARSLELGPAHAHVLSQDRRPYSTRSRPGSRIFALRQPLLELSPRADRFDAVVAASGSDSRPLPSGSALARRRVSVGSDGEILR